MKAFVGHSFQKQDSELVGNVIKFLKAAGLECETGEEAQNKSIAEKVKERILSSDMFVGIFTHDKEIVQKKKFFRNKEKAYTTSNWVVQESGFAVGSNKDLIFLVESGLYKFPELQGDLEVIYFNRQSLAETFLKLTQMIESIKCKEVKAVSAQIQEKPEDLEKQESEKQRQKIKEETKDQSQEAFGKLYDAVFKDKNYVKAQEIYEKELQDALSSEERQDWDAVILRWSHALGDGDAFTRLLDHVSKNKDNPKVIWQLAVRYREMREYQKATDKFLQIRQLYDKNKEENKEKIIGCCEQAAWCLADDSKYNEAIELLSNLLLQEHLKDYKGRILSTLAKIAKRAKNIEEFFIYAEGSLDIDPSNTDLRFDLAWQYGNEGHNKLSVLHYEKLTATKRSPAGLNNLGVGYESLKLPAKSIESYFEAASYNNTLAMSNIAERYLNEGFMKDAEREIKKAHELSKEGIEVHGNVGNAKNRLEKILEDEASKEKEIIVEAEKERKFRVRYSEAFYCDQDVVKEKLDGVWETPWGDLELSFDETTNSFKVDGTKKVKLEGLLESLSMRKTEPEKEHFKTTLIKIKGTVKKLSARYEVKVEDLIEYQYVSPQRTTVYEASGYMVVNEDYKTIDVMEKAKDEKVDIRSWKKKTV
jgi:tetratricopeptide (TPR) repeat protein